MAMSDKQYAAAVNATAILAEHTRVLNEDTIRRNRSVRRRKARSGRERAELGEWSITPDGVIRWSLEKAAA